MTSRNQPCTCPICAQSYSNKYNMQRHYSMIHLHSLRFTCEQCGKCLSSKQNYKEHRYIHTGEKPFECKDCGVRFRQCSQLSVHKRFHRGNKATRCEFKLTDLLSYQKLKELEAFEGASEVFFTEKLLPAFISRDESALCAPLPTLGHLDSRDL